MIYKIPYKSIDLDKYNHCIANSVYPVIYAESWYLDIVTNKDWGIFVLGDYQVVMPITYARMKRSFWKKSVVQPYFCQQLGVFSQGNLTQSEFDLFYQELLKLNPVAYNFNHGNNQFLENKNLKKRTNYVLDLNKPYDELFAAFSKSKRQTVRKSIENNLLLKENSDICDCLDFLNLNTPNVKERGLNYWRNKHVNAVLKNSKGKLISAIYETQITAVAFFVEDCDKIYYLHAASNELGRRLFAIDLILNSIIKEKAGKNISLDFEGSEIPGVAKFVSRYGAIDESYFCYTIK